MEQTTFKGKPVKLIGRMPRVGTQAPELRGVDPELKERSLKEFSGKKKIICFAPSLDTSVCSTSAQKFNQKIGSHPHTVVIYGTMDLPFALQRICMNDKAHYGHIITLSLFRNPHVAESFGALQEDGPLRGLCARAVFVLNEKDEVLYHELVGEITHEPNYDQALSYL